MFIIQKETAEAYIAAQRKPGPPPPPPQPPTPGEPTDVPPIITTTPPSVTPTPGTSYACVRWRGDVPPQKWMNFYTKILSKFATQNGLKIGLVVEIAPTGGVSVQRVDEIKVALRELGITDDIETSG